MPICPDMRPKETNITVEGDMMADWNALENKPERFPAMQHDHAMTEIDGLQAWASQLESEIPRKVSQLENDTGYITKVPEPVMPTWETLEGKPEFFSGDYADLENKPDLFSGRYEDLSGTPTLFNGTYESLTGKPDLFDGRYA